MFIKMDASQGDACLHKSLLVGQFHIEDPSFKYGELADHKGTMDKWMCQLSALQELISVLFKLFDKKTSKSKASQVSSQSWSC